MANHGINHPEVHITASNYEVGGISQLVANLLGYVRMMLFGMIFAGDMIVSALFGNAPPTLARDIAANIKENKIQFGLMAFFGISVAQNALLTSGAFEMYINDELKFSKLNSGRMATIHDVNSIFAEENVFLGDY